MSLSDLNGWSEEKQSEVSQGSFSEEEEKLLKAIEEFRVKIADCEAMFESQGISACANACCACLANSLYQEINEYENQIHSLEKKLEQLRERQEEK